LSGSNQSGSHSPSVTGGESLDVKVEITPAPPTSMADIQNSYSIESTSSLTLCSDVSSKSQATSPMTRKFSELPHGGDSGSFLNPIGFNRLNPSPPNTASQRLFKKIEEMIDLSSPYNHYRCLSPSETNLSKPMAERPLSVSPNPRQMDIGSKPGSSRLLRRQFSLDKDDHHQRHANLETISSLIDSTKAPPIASFKPQYQPLISSSSFPASASSSSATVTPAIVTQSSLMTNKLQKHQSASVAQDLEKIEEIPVSPINVAATSSSSNANDLNSFKNNAANGNNNLKTPPANSSSVNVEAIELR